MSRDCCAFFSVITRPLLVRNGTDVKLPSGRHLRFAVYQEMLLQVVRMYPGIGDWRLLTAQEIEFFYDALRPELRKATRG